MPYDILFTSFLFFSRKYNYSWVTFAMFFFQGLDQVYSTALYLMCI